MRVAGCKARKTVTICRIKLLNIENLKSDIDPSSVLLDTNGPLHDLLNSYVHEIRSVLNKYAPEETRKSSTYPMVYGISKD